MSDHVYKKVELVGSSKVSVTEVDQIRGHIKNGSVEYYQVVMKVGFRIDD